MMGLVLPDRSDPEPPWPWCHPGSCRPASAGPRERARDRTGSCDL